MKIDDQYLVNYFRQQQVPSQVMELVDQYTNNAFIKISNGITEGDIQINQQQDSFLKSEGRNNQSALKKLKIKSLLEAKQKMIVKLHDIYQQESKVRLQLNTQSKSNKKIMERSQMTEQQKQKIKVFVKARKQFQIKMKDEIKSFMDKVKQDERKREQISSLHKQQFVKQRREQIKNHHQQYQKGLNELKRNTRKTKTQSKIYLYQENKKKDDQLQEQKKKFQSLILSQLKSRMKTDFNSIIEHSINHDQSIKKRSIQSQKNSLEKSQKKIPSYPKSSFMKIIKKQSQQRKIKEEKKKRQKRQFFQRIKDYKYYVKLNFHPTSNEESRFVRKTKNCSVTQISFEQRLEIGNKYLKLAKKVKKQKSEIKLQTPSKQNPQNFKIMYKNYLKDLKIHRKNGIDYQEQLNKILNKNQRLSEEQAEKAISLSKKIQQLNQVKPSQDKQKNIASNKIKILEVLIKNQTS